MSRLTTVINVLGHYKIPITIVLGLLFIGVLCDTSIRDLIRLDAQKENLQKEVNFYRQQAADAKQQLEALSKSPAAVEKVAREKYYMRAADEDVFMLSTDKKENNFPSTSYAPE